jgi:hypothetical protein
VERRSALGNPARQFVAPASTRKTPKGTADTHHAGAPIALTTGRMESRLAAFSSAASHPLAHGAIAHDRAAAPQVVERRRDLNRS